MIPLAQAVDQVVGARPSWIIDAGACRGDLAISLRRRWHDATIVCIEPNPTAFSALCRNAQGFWKMLLYPYALSDHSGVGTFFPGRVPEQETVSSLLPRSVGYAGGYQLAEGIQVKLRRLDDLLDDLGWPRIDLLKMDLQGGELLALKGADAALHGGFLPHILTEIWWEPSYVGAPHVTELDAFLAAYGYSRFATSGPSRMQHEGVWGDALYVKTSS